MGTNRHQCFEGLGNALPDEIHVRDIKLLKDMGANFLRVAHYPQDPTIMEMCDKSGIITSVEIPIVNTITVNEQFTKNSLQMAREMVMQDFNRPSVLIWTYMNEVLLKIPNNSNPTKKTEYLTNVGELALKIDNQLSADDAYRYTMIPMHANFEDYDKARLTQIPMIVGWNMYQGWYGGKIEDFEVVLDDFHAKLKDKPVIVTEYGADVDPRLHSFSPVRFDYTAEYADRLHEHYYKAIKERNYISGAAIWNLNDFYSEERENSVPHVNSKGICTLNRELKDSYLFYQAGLLSRPVVSIGSSNWNIRGGIADSNYVCKQALKVYSNLQEIELIVNGKSIGTKAVNENIACFDVPFRNELNTIEAFGKNVQNEIVCDLKKIDFRMIPSSLKDKILPFSEINVMLGSNRFFEDEINNVIWIPEKEYSPGSWGYLGGSSYQKKTKYAQQPASDLDIYNTNIDPVFQTMRSGLKSFKLDVPDGKYTISFYWAELESAKERKVSVYNLGNDAVADNFTKRIFDVSINNVKVKNNLNISEEFGERTAIIFKSVVDVNSGEGLNIEFEPIVGKTMLNAIRVYRNY
jgi:beta-galactosidase